ncbi:MAG TPA: VOC family protein [Chloroflexota bacterium]
MRYSRGLAEIVLIVHDVPRAARFYREVVGLVPHTEPDDAWAWFWAGEPGVNQRVALHKGTLLFEGQAPPFNAREGWGPIHYAFDVPKGKLEAAIENVRSHDVELFGPVRFDWMSAIAYYFYDLDGNLLEFWTPDEEG